MTDSHFIEHQKILYKQLKHCYCNAIGEMVYFTSHGLHHILYNRRRPRSLKERVYRAALINYIVEVITHTSQAIEVIDPKNTTYILWILEYQIKKKYKGRKQIIKVILRKKGNSSVHFLSVMSKIKNN